MAVSIFMLICFISYFTSSADDQSFVLNPMAGDITNTGREFHNSCGSYCETSIQSLNQPQSNLITLVDPPKEGCHKKVMEYVF